jgi:cellulose synthase operon protein C
MKITCPSCQTTYNIDEAKIPAGGATLKCSKCKSTFPVKKTASGVVPLPGGNTPTSSAVALPGGGIPTEGAVPLPSSEGLPPLDNEPTRFVPNPVMIPGAIPPRGRPTDMMPLQASVPLPGSAGIPTQASVPLPGGGFPEQESVPLPGGGFATQESVPLPGNSDQVGRSSVPLPGSSTALTQEAVALPSGSSRGGSVPLPPPPGFRSTEAATVPLPAGGDPPPLVDDTDFDLVTSPPTSPPSPVASQPAPARADADFGIDFDLPPPPTRVDSPAAATAPVQARKIPGTGELDFGDLEPSAPQARPPENEPDPLDFDAGGPVTSPPPATAISPPPSAFPAIMAPPPGPVDDLEFDPTKKKDALEADLSAVSKPRPVKDDLELLDFIDDTAAQVPTDKLNKKSTARYHVRRRSGKVFGPFDQDTVITMLKGGQLLGNEDVSTDGQAWSPIGSISYFSNVIQTLMEAPGALPTGPVITSGDQKKASVERLKSIYGDRMAAVALVDSGPAVSVLAGLRSRLPVLIGLLAVLTVGGVGVYLGFTPYGFFGVRKFFPKRLRPGSAAYAKYQEAEKSFGVDTFAGYQGALTNAQQILASDDALIEVRALFVQSSYALERRYNAGRGSRSRADRYLAELEVSSRDHPEVVKARAAQALVTGGDQALRPALETAALKAPKDPEFEFLLAESLLKARDPNRALAYLEKAEKAAPGLAETRHLQAEAKEMLKDPAAALDLYRKALEANPNHLPSAIAAAHLLITQDRYDEAEPLLAKALNPNSEGHLAPSEKARAHSLMGRILSARRKPKEAEAEFQTASKLDPDAPDVSADYGGFLLARHQYKEAEPLFRNAYQSNPTNVEFIDGLVRTLVGEGNMKDAAGVLHESQSKLPGDARIAFLQGYAAEVADKFDEIEPSFLAATRADPTFYPANIELARYYMQGRRYSDAETQIKEAESKAPKSAWVQTLAGDLGLARKDLDKASAGYNAALALDKNFAPARFGLGQVEFLRGNNAASRSEFEQAMALDPNVPGGRLKYGTLLWKLGELDAAAKVLEDARAAEPRDAEVLVRLGAVRYGQGKFDEALKLLQQSYNFDNANAEAYYYEALAHHEKRESLLAVDVMKQAIERAPRNADYHARMGDILYRADRFQEAVDEWQTAAKLKPDHVGALLALAQGFSEQGDLSKSIDYYQRAEKADPTRKDIVALVGDALFRADQYKKAVEKFAEALKIDPTQTGIYFKLGRCQEQLGQQAKAIEYYQRSLKLDPTNPAPLYYLGYIYKEKGRHNEAVEAFRRYLKARPDGDDRKEIEDAIYFLEHDNGG